MNKTRRNFLAGGALAAAGALRPELFINASATAEEKREKEKKDAHPGNRNSVSTYSFWHFRAIP